MDYTPGNDSVRLQELWSPNRSIFRDVASGEACGRREPRVNQSRRADYEVPFNAIQLLPTVSSGSDTNRIFFGPIRAVTGKDDGKDHKKDWRDWDDWDRDDDKRRTGRRRD